METKKAQELFHTILTSSRHRTSGFCEDSDFASIKLFYQDKEEAEFYLETNKKKKIYRYNNYLYRNILTLPFSREEDSKWLKKQGRFSSKVAISLMLKIREQETKSFSVVSDKEFLLIGRTLYQRYCKVKDLCVTTCGNMLFGNWLSVNIEPVHSGKGSTRLTKKSYNRIVKRQTNFYNKNTRENHGDAGLHIEKIKRWGTCFIPAK